MAERYPTNDSWGHVESDELAERIRDAIEVLNDSETVAQYEENANLHSAHAMREELAASLHVADIEPWQPNNGYETTTCVICGAELERDAES